mgnify:CR=1 FL=1
MKKSILTLVFFIPTILFSQNSISQNENLENLNFYGEKINLDNIQNFKENKVSFLNKKTQTIKIEGKILSTCPMKGCWMKLDVEKDTMLVRFKNYGFFVPKNGAVGKSAIINGIVSVDTISVAQLKHYAEDAGKPEYEIAKIKKPEITLSFLADGVIIKN